MAERPAIQIGFFGRKADPQVKDLVRAARDLGARAHVLDFHNFPRFNTGGAEVGGSACYDDINQPDPISAGALDVAHLRPPCFADLTPGAVSGQTGAADVTRHYRQQVVRIAFQLSLAEGLSRRIPVINRPAAFLHHRQKAHQHQLLVRNGVVTPRAVVTADAAHARDFIKEYDGRVVVKPLASGAEVVMADDAFWDGQGGALTRPFMFQQFVAGRSLRAYLLGGRVVSMGQLQVDGARVDWREHTTGAIPVEPTQELRLQLRRAVQLLDLPYCGVDVEWDAHTERHHVLDLNPAALFVGWSRMLEIDMAGLIVRYLLRAAARGSPWH